MPTCKCGQWFADGAALRTHCQGRHPAGRGSQSVRREEVTG